MKAAMLGPTFGSALTQYAHVFSRLPSRVNGFRPCGTWMFRLRNANIPNIHAN